MSTTRYDVGIVGLGYVGLTLATVLAETGKTVIGIEKRFEVVDKTNRGIPHFSETGLEDALSRVVESGKLSASEQFPEDAVCTPTSSRSGHRCRAPGLRGST